MEEKMMKVFLDLDSDPDNHLDDQTTGLNELGVFLANKESIGKRAKKIGGQGILYSAKSVELYMEAKKLYALGLFNSSIMVCRATAEYIANEIFEKNVESIKSKELSDFIYESLDFRKIVNNYLFKYNIIEKSDKDRFNKIYDIGNKYIHPKKETRNTEEDCENLINYLKELILSLRNLLKEYEIVDGTLRKK